MQDSASKESKLDGWDAIASYLNVSKRTAQSYRKQFDLPVHQLPGNKSRVWAYGPELDSWARNFRPHPEPEAVSPPRRWWPLLLAGALLVLISLGAAVSRKEGRHGTMADIRRQGHDLIALDEAGRELWRYRMPGHLHSSPYSNLDRVKEFVVANLDEDPAPELLFNYIPPDFQETGSTLYCFSGRGHLKWTFKRECPEFR